MKSRHALCPTHTLTFQLIPLHQIFPQRPQIYWLVPFSVVLILISEFSVLSSLFMNIMYLEEGEMFIKVICSGSNRTDFNLELRWVFGIFAISKF